jgi:quinol-cytochrome oxidoreductase complex cytochrome b subunit
VLVTLIFEVIIIFLFVLNFLKRQIKCVNSRVWFFFFCLFTFIFVFITTNRIWSYSIIKSGSMPDKIDSSFRRWTFFLFENIFSILFYIIFANFKVLDIVLERVVHNLVVKGKYPIILEKVSYI